MIPIDTLTFGVELEVLLPCANCAGAGRTALAAALTAAGVPATHEAYNHSRRNHWKVTTDASIGYDNAEVVSPVLVGNTGLAALRAVTATLVAFGCRVDRRTGTHVHVGVRDHPDLGEERVGFFKELLRTTAKFRPVLQQLVAPSRRGNGYCRFLAWRDEMASATNLRDLWRLANGGHFSVPNFHDAYVRHGTVEFRQHQGTLSAEKLENWVKLCLRLVAHAARNTERAAPSRSPFVDLLRPTYPPEPRRPEQPAFPARPRDLSAASVVPATKLNRSDLRWSLGRGGSWIFRERRGPNPRRPTARGYATWDLYVVGTSVRAFVEHGGSLPDLRYDVERGRVVVVDQAAAPERPLTPEEAADRDARTEAHAQALAAWHGEHDAWVRTVTALRDDYTRRNDAARAAWLSQPIPAGTPAVERPPTDEAPVTLDGFLTLLAVPEPERSFFHDRLLELNAA